jgi:acetyl-CoA carboxylase alpha subunit
MSDVLDKINELKNGIEELKKVKARKEAEIQVLLEDLKKKFGIKTLNEAYTVLDDMEDDLERTKEEREKAYHSIKNELDKLL